MLVIDLLALPFALFVLVVGVVLILADEGEAPAGATHPTTRV